MKPLQTIEIQHPEIEGAKRVINVADFDPAKDKPFGEEAETIAKTVSPASEASDEDTSEDEGIAEDEDEDEDDDGLDELKVKELDALIDEEDLGVDKALKREKKVAAIREVRV